MRAGERVQPRIVWIIAALVAGWLGHWCWQLLAEGQDVNGTHLSRFELQALALKNDEKAQRYALIKRLEDMPSRDLAERTLEKWIEIGLIRGRDYFEKALAGFEFPDERRASSLFTQRMHQLGIDYEELSQSVASEIAAEVQSGEISESARPDDWKVVMSSDPWRKGTPEARLRILLRYRFLTDRWFVINHGEKPEEASRSGERFVRSWRLTASTCD